MNGKPPTKAESLHMGLVASLGCLICRLRGMGYQPSEVHHTLSGGRRRGHMFTMALCPWHHRGVPTGKKGLHSINDYRETFGPSLADGTKVFRAAYGSDDDLLAKQAELMSK